MEGMLLQARPCLAEIMYGVGGTEEERNQADFVGG